MSSTAFRPTPRATHAPAARPCPRRRLRPVPSLRRAAPALLAYVAVRATGKNREKRIPTPGRSGVTPLRGGVVSGWTGQ